MQHNSLDAIAVRVDKGSSDSPAVAIECQIDDHGVIFIVHEWHRGDFRCSVCGGRSWKVRLDAEGNGDYRCYDHPHTSPQ